MTRARGPKAKKVDAKHVHNDHETSCYPAMSIHADKGNERTERVCGRIVDTLSSGNGLRCTVCKRYVHFGCSELPGCQITLFVKTAWKFMCKRCVTDSLGEISLGFSNKVCTENCAPVDGPSVDHQTEKTEQSDEKVDGSASVSVIPKDFVVNDFVSEIKSSQEEITQQLTEIKTILLQTQTKDTTTPSQSSSQHTQTDKVPETPTNTHMQYATYADCEIWQNTKQSPKNRLCR